MLSGELLRLDFLVSWVHRISVALRGNPWMQLTLPDADEMPAAVPRCPILVLTDPIAQNCFLFVYFLNAFDIGSLYQNMVFYSILITMLYMNIMLLRTGKKRRNQAA